MIRLLTAMLILGCGTVSDAEGVRTRLDDLGKAHADYLAKKEQALEAYRKRHGVVRGDWYCVGPFKDDAFGGLFESFEYLFAPEKDAMDSGGVPDLEKLYEAKKFPGMLDTKRPWKKHPEWEDGFRNLLPRGPAPSNFETVYLYRTIDTAEAVTVEMSINAEDHIGIWLNGQKGATAVRAERQPSRYPAQLRTDLSLRRGRNHLLVKITSMWGAHGFAFGLKDITPYNPLVPLQWSPSIIRDAKSGRNNFTIADQPWFAHGKAIAETQPQPQSAACIAIMAERLELPVALIQETLEGATPAELQVLSRQVTAFADALARLRSLRVVPEPIPMFSPAHYEIETYRAEHEVASPNASRYLAELEKTGKAVEAALALQASGEVGGIQAVLQAEKKLNDFWDREIKGMPPVVFLKCPRTQLNAVRPYDSAGPRPASICLFDPSRPQDFVRTIFHQPDMAIRDLNLSYDAKTIFFSGQSGATGHTWQLFEIGVDGKGLRQITRGEHHNISPCELPNGRLVFVSTRNQLWVTCQGGGSGVLFSCNRDGSHVKLLSANIDSDHTPQVLEDGRVMFTRWDYGIEKNVFARHALWTMNPDGSNLALLFGNTIEDPAGFWQARAVPGRSEIVATFGPHHSGQAGMMGVIWPRNGTEQPRGKGFRFITREIPSYCDTTCHFGYQDPFPLHERLFLVSYGGDGGQRNRLYLIDDRGNKKCFYEAEDDLCCYNPQPLVARKRPPYPLPQCSNPDWEPMDPIARSRTPPAVAMGTLMVQDVYRGISKRVKRGEAATIQIMEQLRKTTRHLQDAWGTSPLMGRGTVHVRRVIGTVPIEEDGSASFHVPALRNISLNLLDKDGKILMRMGSDMHVMPGEKRGCVGCHEVREDESTPMTSPSIAMGKAPVQPVRPPWGNEGILDYQKLIQPIWDKYCIECHSGPTPEGMVDMTGDRTRYFCMSYDNLIEREIVDYHNVFALGHDENTPKSLGSYVSRISEFIDSEKHSGKRLSADEKRLIYTWIDANVPYYSTYQFNRPETRGSRDGWAFSEKMFTTFDRNCMGCHERKVYASALYGGWLRVSSDVWRSRGYSAHGITWRWKETPHIGPELRVNLTNPSHSPLLQAPLAEGAGGWGLCRSEDGKPYIFPNKTNPTYQLMLREIEVACRKFVERPRADISPQYLAELKEKVLLDIVGKREILMLADENVMDMVSRGTFPMLGQPEKPGGLSANKLTDQKVAAGRKPSGLAAPDGSRRSAKSVAHSRTSPNGPLTRVQDWLRICGESVFSTRPFAVPSEGPHAIGAEIHDGSDEFTREDMRFRRNSANTVLYAIAFGWPGNGAQLNIVTLNADDFDSSTITSIALLGVSDRLAWKQDDEGLKVTMPSKPSYDAAYPLKITFKGAIPTLKVPMVKNDTDASITYTGSWSHHSLPGCFESDETFTARNNDHAVIAFEGTSISILSRVHPQFGTFKVYIDGKSDADVNTYAARPADQQRVYTRTGLSNAPHTLKIVKTSGAWIGIDGYEINPE